MQLHLIFVSVEVVHEVFCSVESFYLWHSEFWLEREMQHPCSEWGFSLLHQGIHGDWDLALHYLLHLVELFLDVFEALFPVVLSPLLVVWEEIAPLPLPILTLHFFILTIPGG